MNVQFLSPVDLSKRWGISPGTLANWRSRGCGPAYRKIGTVVRYALADILSYENEVMVNAA